jgi:hypothetical protein
MSPMSQLLGNLILNSLYLNSHSFLLSDLIFFKSDNFFPLKKTHLLQWKQNSPNFSPKKFHKVMKSCHKTNGLTSVGTIIHDMCNMITIAFLCVKNQLSHNFPIL